MVDTDSARETASGTGASEFDTGVGIEELHFELPDELIAQQPLPVRHESRLLKLDRKTGEIAHTRFSKIGSCLRSGDVLVVNDTRVVPSRLYALRESGGLIEILLIRARAGKNHSWEAMATPVRRLKRGETLYALDSRGERRAIVVEDIFIDQDGFKRLIIDLGQKTNVQRFLQETGFAPLPPYIERKRELEKLEQPENDPARASDLERYQTVFAREPGAVAAPTAGLHFSDELLLELQADGVELHKLTLHVGPGTFKPITTSIAEHTIEAERFTVPASTADAINRAKEENRRVIAVGTTSLRALETAGRNGRVEAVNDAETTLYVKPGYRFRAVDGMVTNFHLSGSSLLVLVAAFAGTESIMNAYRQAVAERYRFFSYGDAMLII